MCDTSQQNNISHDKLDATLWAQTSVEYQLLTAQAYRLAKIQLDKALQDSLWTAALEQISNYSVLPPAVILDIDETVLDNSAFESRLVVHNQIYNEQLWAQWVKEEQASAVTGVIDFITYAKMKGVKVFYITNRHSMLEQNTINNMNTVLGMDISGEDILTKYERPGWDSKKTQRRQYVANSHRILLLIGDDYNDFMLLDVKNLDQRVQQAKEHYAYWGTKWIQMPNPTYGHWEGIIYGNDYSLSIKEKRRLKYQHLETKER